MAGHWIEEITVDSERKIEYGPEPWLQHYWELFLKGVEPDYRGKDQTVAYFVKDKERKMFPELKNEHVIELRYELVDEFDDFQRISAVRLENL